MKKQISEPQRSSEIYYRIEKVLEILEKRYKDHPMLDQIAEDAFLSKYHFQRLFKRFVGLSPKKFLQFLTVEHAKKLLEESRTILDTTFEVGLSSAGRLHDLFINCEAMTPGMYKEKGKGMKIIYGIHPTPFGECLISITEKGICGFDFILENDIKKVLIDLQQKWKYSEIIHNDNSTGRYIEKIFNSSKNKSGLNLLLKGTDFQIKVWQALLKIPSGYVSSYEDISIHIGSDKSVRAVANAVANNPISYLILCHRVIRKMGVIGNYHWGKARKKALLGWEMSKVKYTAEKAHE